MSYRQLLIRHLMGVNLEKRAAEFESLPVLPEQASESRGAGMGGVNNHPRGRARQNAVTPTVAKAPSTNPVNSQPDQNFMQGGKAPQYRKSQEIMQQLAREETAARREAIYKKISAPGYGSNPNDYAIDLDFNPRGYSSMFVHNALHSSDPIWAPGSAAAYQEGTLAMPVPESHDSGYEFDLDSAAPWVQAAIVGNGVAGSIDDSHGNWSKFKDVAANSLGTGGKLVVRSLPLVGGYFDACNAADIYGGLTDPNKRTSDWYWNHKFDGLYYPGLALSALGNGIYGWNNPATRSVAGRVGSTLLNAFNGAIGIGPLEQVSTKAWGKLGKGPSLTKYVGTNFGAAARRMGIQGAGRLAPWLASMGSAMTWGPAAYSLGELGGSIMSRESGPRMERQVKNYSDVMNQITDPRERAIEDRYWRGAYPLASDIGKNLANGFTWLPRTMTWVPAKGISYIPYAPDLSNEQPIRGFGPKSNEQSSTYGRKPNMTPVREQAIALETRAIGRAPENTPARADQIFHLKYRVLRAKAQDLVDQIANAPTQEERVRLQTQYSDCIRERNSLAAQIYDFYQNKQNYDTSLYGEDGALAPQSQEDIDSWRYQFDVDVDEYGNPVPTDYTRQVDAVTPVPFYEEPEPPRNEPVQPRLIPWMVTPGLDGPFADPLNPRPAA